MPTPTKQVPLFPPHLALAKAKQGTFMVLDNDSLGKCLLVGGDYEQHFAQVVTGLLKPGDHCIDLGANLGYHAVTMGRLVGAKGAVWAFEPQRLLHKQLCGNIFLNGLRNMQAFQLAVGDEEKMTAIEAVDYDDPDLNTGQARIAEEGEGIRMTTLDSFGFPRVDFIKADMQGCEEKFLIGAKATIAKHRPVMWLEVEESFLNKFGTSSQNLLNRLLGLDYVLVRIEADNDFGSFPWDHLCVPKEKKGKIAGWLSGLQYKHDLIEGSSVELTFDRLAGNWTDGECYGSYKVNP
jgi:FkbM family methyltransferase